MALCFAFSLLVNFVLIWLLVKPHSTIAPSDVICRNFGPNGDNLFSQGLQNPSAGKGAPPAHPCIALQAIATRNDNATL